MYQKAYAFTTFFPFIDLFNTLLIDISEFEISKEYNLKNLILHL